MAKVECCGNCYFFRADKNDLCARFPPPQQAMVREDDWCGEWEPFEPAAPDTAPKPVAPPTEAHSVIAEAASKNKPKPKHERLSSFGELAKRI